MVIKMEKCDFLLCYEIKNRELEALCLLKYELERRGYTVIIREWLTSWYFDMQNQIDAKVLVIGAFNSYNHIQYASYQCRRTAKLVNLQWEQIISKEDLNNKDFLRAIKAEKHIPMTISWGTDNYSRMVNTYGINEEFVRCTGHIGMDFLHGKLTKYYLSKEDIYAQYSFDKGKKMILFISSFSSTTLDSSYYDLLYKNDKKRSREMKEMQSIAIESKKIILSWFDEYLKDNNRNIIVYRPHPEEHKDDSLIDLEKRHSNFKVIRDYSIRQWILTADQITTWASTSLAEIYFAQKKCVALQPLSLVGTHMENDMYRHMTIARNKKEFFEYVDRTDGGVFLPDDYIKKYYYSDKTRYTYEIICDLLEDVFQSEKYNLEKELNCPKGIKLIIRKIECFMKRMIAHSTICKMIYKHHILEKLNLQKYINDVYYEKSKLQLNKVDQNEIDEIVNRIEFCMKE